MSSMLLASSLLHSSTTRPRPDYADLYEGPGTGLRDTLRIGTALAAILTYTGLLTLL